MWGKWSRRSNRRPSLEILPFPHSAHHHYESAIAIEKGNRSLRELSLVAAARTAPASIFSETLHKSRRSRGDSNALRRGKIGIDEHEIPLGRFCTPYRDCIGQGRLRLLCQGGPPRSVWGRGGGAKVAKANRNEHVLLHGR